MAEFTRCTCHHWYAVIGELRLVVPCRLLASVRTASSEDDEDDDDDDDDDEDDEEDEGNADATHAAASA